MRTTWQRIISVVVLVGTAVIIGIWTGRGLSQVTTEEKPPPAKFLRLLGHQTLGRNLLFSIYCDIERGHLLYNYTWVTSPSAPPRRNCRTCVEGVQDGVMDLPFDPAIAAHNAFQLAQRRKELGADGASAAEWEAAFSASAGAEATQAYRRLLTLGDRYPTARAFQEFLIYSTWQQAAEDPIAEHFQQGLKLCDRFLARMEPSDARNLTQVRALRVSFLNGLGIQEHDEIAEEHDRDAFKGGD